MRALPKTSKVSLKPGRPAGARTGSRAGDDATTLPDTPWQAVTGLTGLFGRSASTGIT
jgi:hypothetical protein